MNNLLISVVIPLYNKEKTIEQSLHSVLRQKDCEFEIVVVDDGSTDNSVEQVKKINDTRVRLVSQKNGGPGAARNTGAKAAKGDWIVFLDADDELLPNALKSFAKAILAHPNIDIFDANKYILTGDNKILAYHPLKGYIKNPLKECFFSRILPGNGSSAFRRSFFLKNMYDERIRRFEDAELLIRQLSCAKVYSLKTPTLLFNRNFAEASRPRKNVMEDYFAYLDFSKGGFWRKMCVYRTFLEERELYPEYGKKHYAKMYKRYDWLLMYKLLNWLAKFLKKQ